MPAGGFTPGAIILGRYRIIGLLGRGGMGEVYRADDLKLGQAVALKFLPPALAEDPVRRERFFAEVRIARQVSHPNICRVYDIAELEDPASKQPRYFLTMEYIDGEDLASLIQRIGYLSNEKALDLAKQLAAGLAAAHERGVLHRDLKPANIMVDGRGRVRITDFGLAIAATDDVQATDVAGTPAYMAPEQLAGKGATVRSDIYSLGLVLYELYTGTRAFTAVTLPELRQQKESVVPTAPSDLRAGVDPIVERVITRCLERDPRARPGSVAQVSAALPGGDPLAAALAAGETPSPEMVAAAGGGTAVRPLVAVALLAFIVLGLAASPVLQGRLMLHRQVPFEKSPEILAEQARRILTDIGYTGIPASRAFGFAGNADYADYMRQNRAPWTQISPQALLFWYRQSPQTLEPVVSSPTQRVTMSNPVIQVPDETLVVMDTEGHLVSFRAVPPRSDPSASAAIAPDWARLMRAAGLKFDDWVRTEPEWNPPSYADEREAWVSTTAKNSSTPLRIEAAAYRGKISSFEVIQPWTAGVGAESATSATVASAVGLGLVLAVLMCAAMVARRNLRLGRGDRRGATRLSMFAVMMLTISWLLTTDHVLTLWEFELFATFAGWALLISGACWMFYIAVEPFVRRQWPHTLISWTRLLAGEWRDPLLGRDVLIGCAAGVAVAAISLVVPDRFTAALPPIMFKDTAVHGTAGLIGGLAFQLVINCGVALGNVCLLFLLRVVLRRDSLAMGVFVLVAGVISGLRGSPVAGFMSVVFLVIAMLVLKRIGLVALIALFFVEGTLLANGVPIAYQPSVWYSGTGYGAVAIIAALALYGFRTSLGGRRVFEFADVGG